MSIEQKLSPYFKPKKFEFYRDKTVYELVGVKFYKKYLPTTGDIVRKRRNIVQIRLSNADRIDELYNYERKTRNNEYRHLIGIVIFILLTLLFTVPPLLDGKLTVFEGVFLIVFLTVLNLCINIYPILLQRYNRIRILKVLENNGLPNPYNK